MSLTVDTTAGPSAPPPARPARGWWRRNLWGLLALVPLLAGQFVLNVDIFIERTFERKPREAIVAAPGESVEFDNTDLRLISLTEIPPHADQVGEGRTLPAGLTIWRAVVGVDRHAGVESFITTCSMYLEDEAGRLFDPKPSELRGFELGSFGCLQKDFEPDRSFDDVLNPQAEDEFAPYQSTQYFVMPSDARPKGVRVELLLQLPRYVLLAAG
jgi:hypothetical protein